MKANCYLGFERVKSKVIENANYNLWVRYRVRAI